MNSFLKKGDFGSGLTKNSSTLILRMSTMIKENLKENCPFLKEIMWNISDLEGNNSFFDYYIFLFVHVYSIL